MRGRAIAQNPEVLKLETISKWIGAVPQFISGENNKIVPIFDVMTLKKASPNTRE